MTVSSRIYASSRMSNGKPLLRLRTVACLISLGAVIGVAYGSSTSAPSKPGIFGVGFTDITDHSARLVFTTSEPMSTTVEIFEQKAKCQSLPQPSFDEIHAIVLSELKRQTDYRIMITATGNEGNAIYKEVNFRPAQRAASKHLWPGYTVFSSTMEGNNPENMDLLARSGARMARIEIGWDGVFPTRGTINHNFLDKSVRTIAEMKKRGIEPLVVLDYCVQWAKPYTDQTMTWRNVNFGPPDELAEWELYVRTVVSALHGSARYYEVWNEPDAGYLATGSYVERPNLPPPIGRPPYKDNWNYWLGDRYVPMIEAVRTVMEELQPDALVMNGGWNRDYGGQRGDLLMQRGAGPSLDLYAYHVYSHSPWSFSRWYTEIDGGFRENIDRIFKKNGVNFPLAVTEWGMPTWATPPEGKGFASFEDSQLFYLKCTFYFLSMERFEILSQFSLGTGPPTLNRNETMFQLINEETPHQPVFTPTFDTFQWIANTFSNKVYRALPVQIVDKPRVKAYAIQMKDSRDTYIAIWQDGDTDKDGVITPLPARELTASIGDVQPGTYQMDVLDIDGRTQSKATLQASSSLTLQIPVPPATTSSESGIFLARISRKP